MTSEYHLIYAAGKGLCVYADGREIAAAETLGRLTGALPTVKLRSPGEAG